jgi:hypothetical protein
LARLVDRYRLYIDESGDHVFCDRKTLEQPPHRYLALAGCSFSRAAYTDFQMATDQFKRKHIPHDPDEPVLLHRTDILGARGHFWRLRDPSARQSFNDDLLVLVAAADCLVTLVVIDKLQLIMRYSRPFDPYNMAMHFLLQRYCFQLGNVGRQGDVMAESRNGKEDGELADTYRDIYANGDEYVNMATYQQCLTSGELKLKRKSANVAGLQLADLLAHPLKQAFLAERGLIQPPAAAFARRFAAAAAAKYDRNPRNGEIDGYGRVLFPK